MDHFEGPAQFGPPLLAPAPAAIGRRVGNSRLRLLHGVGGGPDGSRGNGCAVSVVYILDTPGDKDFVGQDVNRLAAMKVSQNGQRYLNSSSCDPVR